ncbi:MAG: hypothetical protein WKI04_18380, partial [Ferruginibacter sp.]
QDWAHRITPDQVAAIKNNPLLLFHNNLIGAPSTTIIRKNSILHFDPKLKWHVDIDYYIRQILENRTIIYSDDLLVVTFLADGRVTDECKGNREVEVFEYFYLLEQFQRFNNEHLSSAALKKCILKVITVCHNFKIKSLKDIRDCGYSGEIWLSIRIWLRLNSLSTALGLLYIKFLRHTSTVST